MGRRSLYWNSKGANTTLCVGFLPEVCVFSFFMAFYFLEQVQVHSQFEKVEIFSICPLPLHAWPPPLSVPLQWPSCYGWWTHTDTVIWGPQLTLGSPLGGVDLVGLYSPRFLTGESENPGRNQIKMSRMQRWGQSGQEIKRSSNLLIQFHIKPWQWLVARLRGAMAWALNWPHSHQI